MPVCLKASIVIAGTDTHRMELSNAGELCGVQQAGVSVENVRTVGVEQITPSRRRNVLQAGGGGIKVGSPSLWFPLPFERSVIICTLVAVSLCKRRAHGSQPCFPS
jgi:hypothetical protein